jgi:hypothetical protein
LVQILSVKELRHLTRTALETHKLELCLAKIKAPTDLEREAIDVQLQRVGSLQNEYCPKEAHCYV